MFKKTKRKKRKIRKNRLWSLLLAFFVVIGLFAFGQGKVVKVSDGDSLTLFSSDGKFETIRLYGVDSPEYFQEGGIAAYEFTKELVFLQEVKITPINKDQYGRTVALVHLKDGRNLNEELLRSGYAWQYGAYCKEAWCPAWKLLEIEARQAKKGLWAKAKPTPPWKWRKNKNK